MGTTLFDSIPHLVDEVEKLINHYRGYEKGGWTHESVTDMIGRFVASVTRLVYCPFCVAHAASAVVGAAGDHVECIEKNTVLKAFERLYDSVIAPIKIPFVPDLVEKLYIDPAVRTFLRDQASNLFDLVQTILKSAASGVPNVVGLAGTGEPAIVSDGPLFGPVLAY